MLHNFCSDTAPPHVRDFYMARLYRTPTQADTAHSTTPHNSMADYRVSSTIHPDSPHSLPPPPPQTHLPTHELSPARAHSVPHMSCHSSLPPLLSRPRPRGGDGRFVPRSEDYSSADNRYSKICGWCRTTSTSQWRVGPTNGSIEMGTLCNACGINYRRALAKAPGGILNLDRLAQQMGHTRLSIQKALKRQRKLSATPAHMKRTRAEGRTRLPIQLSRVEPSMDMMACRWDENNGQTRPTMALSTHSGSPSAVTTTPTSPNTVSPAIPPLPPAFSMALPVPRAVVPTGVQGYAGGAAVSARSAPYPVPSRSEGVVRRTSSPPGSPAEQKAGSWRSGTESMTFSPPKSEGQARSRLPGFQSFIGSLER